MHQCTSHPVTADNAIAGSRMTMPIRHNWNTAKLALPSLRNPALKRISKYS